ncbi:MAG: sugar phosphate nucleotidyltransferase [Candidatus Omnitrophota bacterium]|nr:sugar phosphate nucleotidyltransferase [Candidatus Omnitrophota bacterium]
MKGVILAGGLGTRMRPLTNVTNKHLLPVYDRPMIFFPLQTLVDAGIRDILIVTGGNSSGDFLRLIGNGSAFGLSYVNYAYQKGEGGIAEALGLAEHFIGGDKVAVVLGDNIFQDNIAPHVRAFERQREGAKILIKKVPDPERFGVASLQGGRVTRIEEKPRRPKSNTIVTGIYLYDSQVFKIIKRLKPSKRGELEITDVNNRYIQQGQMTYGVLKGFWSDCGTFDSLLRSSQLIARQKKRR